MEQAIQLKSVRVQYKETKFKFLLKDPSQNFAQLKSDILTRLIEMNQVMSDPSNYIIADEYDFAYSDNDMVSQLLGQNELIKILSVQNTQEKDTSIIEEAKQNVQPGESTTIQDGKKDLDDIQRMQKQNPVDESLKADNAKLSSNIQEADINAEQKDSPAEAIVVLIDVSGSMRGSFFGDTLLSRMGAVNALFSAFADKTIAYEYDHTVQLIWFDDKIDKKCDFSKDMNQFIRLVDSATPGGSTRLYDALMVGVKSLLEFKKDHPHTLLRMIALTDGEDNQSKSQPDEVAKEIIRNGIVLDSFVVSDQSFGLKTITHASGGRCYCPRDLFVGMKLFEIETILSVKARDIVLPKQANMIFDSNFKVDLNALQDKPFDTEGIQAQKASEKMKSQPVSDLQDIIKKYQNKEPDQQPKAQSQSQPNQPGSSNYSASLIKRVVKELQTIVENPAVQKCARVFPAKDDITQMKLLLAGPRGSNYQGGVYLVSIQLPRDYPFKPPSVQFITPIYHCNVNSQGRICLDVLKDNWSPALTIATVIISLESLMLDPNPQDALESNIAAEMNHEHTLFQKHCREHVKQHANRSVDQLIADIMGSSLNATDEFYQKTHADLTSWLHSLC